jgi:hypothetical protein
MFLFLGIVFGTPTCYVKRCLLKYPVVKSIAKIYVALAQNSKKNEKAKNVFKSLLA